MVTRKYIPRLIKKLKARDEIKITSSLVGAAGEMVVAADLMYCGYHVLRSVARTGPIDLVAYDTTTKETLRIDVANCSKNPAMTHGVSERKLKSNEHIDVVAIFVDGEVEYYFREED